METRALRQQQQKVKQYFDEKSSYWKDVYSIPGVQAEIIRDRHAAVLEWIDDLRLARGSRILEIGCGAGFMSIALSLRGFQVQAIDSVKAMIELAKGNARKAGATTASFQLGDTYCLNWNDASFDLVLAIGVVPWLEQAELAMKEMARVTKTGGHVLVTTANRAGLASLLDPLISPLLQPAKLKIKSILVTFGLRPRTPHMVFHSNRYCDTVLGNSGLVKIRAMTRGFGFSFFRRTALPEPQATKLNRKLQNLADRDVPGIRSGGMAYFVLAQKKKAREPTV